MKKATFVLIAVLFLIIFTGCTATKTITKYYNSDNELIRESESSESVVKSVADAASNKSINIEGTIWGGKIITSDITANGASTARFGFGTFKYRSAPMEKGQPYYVEESVGSIWGNAITTKIWIGRASEKSILKYQAIPSTMIKISGNSISSNDTTVTVEKTEK